MHHFKKALDRIAVDLNDDSFSQTRKHLFSELGTEEALAFGNWKVAESNLQWEQA